MMQTAQKLIRSALPRASRVGVAPLATQRYARALMATRSYSSFGLRTHSAPMKCGYLSQRTFSSWVIDTEGKEGTVEWRMFYRGADNQRVSAWHDIPLRVEGEQGSFNYVNEIPKGTRPKMEIATKEETNPIKQDIKKGNLRVFNYGDIPFNYGCLPQTWEDPNVQHPLTGYAGDNDPVDVCEISNEPLPMGSVTPVKLLGILALIDEGETDWKVICISTANPLANEINDLASLNAALPNCVDDIREWFRMYKTADGKPENTFAFDGEAKDVDVAAEVVEETHQSWKDLVAGKIPANGLHVKSG